MPTLQRRRLVLANQVDNPFLFLAPLNGSLTFYERSNPASGDGQSKTGTLTGSGAVRYQAANGAETNYALDPRGTALTNWPPNGSGTRTVGSGDGPLGTYIEVTGNLTGDSVVPVTPNIPGLGNGVSVVFSFWAWSVSGATDWAVVPKWKLGDGSSISSGSSIPFTVTATPQRFVVTANAVNGSQRAYMAIGRASAASGVIRVTGAKIKLGNTDTTPYFDGTTGAWLDPITGILGTANASPSVTQAAAWIEEATTNAIRNPSANVDTSDWVGQNSAVVTRDTTYARIGSAAFKIVASGASADQGMYATYNVPATNGQTWTISAYVRGTVTGVIGVDILDGSNAGIAAFVSSGVAANDSWGTRFTLTFTIASATAASFAMFVRTNSAQNTTFWVTNIQPEQKAYATSYADGSIGTGYAWTGTANASTSTRTATLVKVDETNRIRADQGAVASRFAMSYDSGSALDQTVFSLGLASAASTEFMDLYVKGSDNKLHMQVKPGTGTATDVNVAASQSTGVSALAYGEWDASHVAVGVDTGTLVSVARAAASTGSVSTASDMAFGCYSGGSTQHVDGVLGPVAILARPATAKEKTKFNVTPLWSWKMLDAA